MKPELKKQKLKKPVLVNKPRGKKTPVAKLCGDRGDVSGGKGGD